MNKFSATPLQMFKSLWCNRELIKMSAKREVYQRYRGSFLGLLWSMINPMFMLAVFTFVFGFIFKSRWDGINVSRVEFALLLFIGLLFFNLLAESINRAPNLILSNVNYVKKVVFPLEILPVINLLSGMFHTLIGLGVWLIGYVFFIGIPHLTVFLLPLVFLPFCLFIIGLGWIFASIGVFIRDISQFTGTLMTALMFLSPIFYPITAFPEGYRFILYFNPLTIMVNETRNLIFWGENPDFLVIGLYWALTFFIAWLGFLCFQKTRRGFSDVL